MKLPAIRINPLGVLVLSGAAVFFLFLYVSGWYHKKEETSISLKHLLAVGISAAEAGGRKVRDVRLESHLKERSKGKTKEGANDPLTDGDLLSHRSMMYVLQKTFPTLKIVSEEHEDDVNAVPVDAAVPHPRWDSIKSVTDDIEIPSKDILVWIDPLDATKEYTENLLEYVTTMVCVAVRGMPVIGIIHKPFENVTDWAWFNHGISDMEFEMPSKESSSRRAKTIIVSRSHAGKVGEVAKAAFGPETKIVSAGGAGYKVLQVVKNKADAYVHVTLIKKWDICAGNAIINAFGGQMTTLDGSLINYSNRDQVGNEKGLIATLHNHKDYVDKLSSFRN